MLGVCEVETDLIHIHAPQSHLGYDISCSMPTLYLIPNETRHPPTLSSRSLRFLSTASRFVEVCICGRQKEAMLRLFPLVMVWEMLIASSTDS